MFAVGDRVRPNFTAHVTLGRVLEVIEPGSERLMPANRGEGGVVLVWDEVPGAVVWPDSSLVRCANNDLRRLVAKFPGKCGGCSNRVAAGEGVFYSPGAKKVYHVGCA